MQSIITKYIPPSNHRGARIKATCERGSITVPFDYGLDEVSRHFAAVRSLVEKFVAEDTLTHGTLPADNPWACPMTCLPTPVGYVFGWPVDVGNRLPPFCSLVNDTTHT